MKHQFKLEGLDYVSCAANIERALSKLAGIDSVVVNSINDVLTVETSGSGDMDSLIVGTVKQMVPRVKITETYHGEETPHVDKGHDHAHEEGGKGQLIRLIAGAALFAVGFILKTFWTLPNLAVLVIFLVSYLVLGGDVLLRAGKNILRGQIFDENFLMSIATIGAFIIGDYPEGAAVMLFYQVGEYFQGLAIRRSKKSITSLMDIRPDYANLKVGGDVQRVSPENVEIGQLILVKPGEKIPLDGIVVDGEALLDTSALTGESVPRKVSASDTVLSGCINQNGLLTVEVTKTFGQSTVAKIIDLVENASSKKAPTENFITTFSRYYTPVVVGITALLAIIPPLFLGGIWAEWVKRGLIFLVISCPCALVVSIPLGFFGGIGGASKKGVLVKGSNYLEALNALDIVVFDKTGTLTKGVFEVTAIHPANGYSAEQLLAYAAQAESFSNHPIAHSILKSFEGIVDKENLTDYTEIAGHGISVKAGTQTILAGNRRLMDTENVPFEEAAEPGTKVYVAVDGTFVGSLIISDEIKADSARAIALLKERGVRKTVMLTGDTPEIAEAIAKELKLDEVYGGLLPAQKVEKVEILETQKREKGKLAFVGDGINDAPVLARADIGIAMGGLGSDAAIEAADIVLMTDEPSKLAEAMDIAKFTKRIVWQNILFALVVKGIFLLLGAFGIATMWEAVFADVGVSLLAILNAMRVLRKA